MLKPSLEASCLCISLSASSLLHSLRAAGRLCPSGAPSSLLTLLPESPLAPCRRFDNVCMEHPAFLWLSTCVFIFQHGVGFLPGLTGFMSTHVAVARQRVTGCCGSGPRRCQRASCRWQQASVSRHYSAHLGLSSTLFLSLAQGLAQCLHAHTNVFSCLGDLAPFPGSPSGEQGA